jgi:hypothetical protein
LNIEAVYPPTHSYQSHTGHAPSATINHSMITITLTTTVTYSAFALLVSGQEEFRQTQLLTAGRDNGLFQALIWSLRMVTDKRISALLAPRTRRPSSANAVITREQKLLPVNIRTSNADLVEAAVFLRGETEAPLEVPAISMLRKELQRFDVHWELLEADASEIRALRRWASRTGRKTYTRLGSEHKVTVSSFCQK